MPTSRRHRHRQRAGRRAEPGERGLRAPRRGSPRAPCSSWTRRGPASSTRRWGPASRSRAARPPTRSSGWRRSAVARTTSARCATTSSARCSPTTCAAVGVGFTTPRATSGPPTGRCLIVVTPDAQRTLNTFLGASVHLGPADVDAALVARGRILYLEGYLFDPPAAQQAFRVAADHRPRRRPQGRADALRPVLRRPSSGGVPRAGRAPRRHPVRQRGGDPRALRGARLRRGGEARARPLRRWPR